MIIRIPERTQKSKKGLIQFANYISSSYPKIKTLLEIGSWTGVSAKIFAKYFEKVVCVDPWKATLEINTEYDMNQVFNIFMQRVKNYNNIIYYKMTSEEFFDKTIYGIDNKFDIIYIDGLHEYQFVKQDLMLWKNRCKIISGHDYWKGRFNGVIQAVDEIVGKPDKIFDDTSWFKVLK